MHPTEHATPRRGVWSPATPHADLHVHSTFSDGKGTVAENIAAAREAGLHRLGCIDHVRADTTWLPAFVATIRAARATAGLDLLINVEAKLLDQRGTLDLPRDLDGVDLVFAADHQIPLGDACLGPRAVREMIAAGQTTPAAIIGAIVDATIGAAERYPRLVIAHLWSVLPKIGVSEDEVPDGELARLGEALARRKVAVEIDEQWACPGVRVAKALHASGVMLLASSDSHRPGGIGVYDHVHQVFAAVARVA